MVCDYHLPFHAAQLLHFWHIHLHNVCYFEHEKEAFEKDPLNCEINSVVNKIYCEIGKRAEEQRIAEQNAAHEDHKEPEADDIFSEINTPNSDDDGDIF